jgi:hypothetical protein
MPARHAVASQRVGLTPEEQVFSYLSGAERESALVVICTMMKCEYRENTLTERCILDNVAISFRTGGERVLAAAAVDAAAIACCSN